MRTAADGRGAIPLLIVVLGVLFSLAMFRGLEHSAGYQGSVYQALHPGSFPGDRFMSPLRPTMVSTYYLLVKLVGDVWLDDRFTIVVFAGLAMLALAGVDKTAQLLGARHPHERIAMLSLMVLAHKVLDNQGQLLGSEFNATLFSSPLVIWLLFECLSGPRPPVVVPLMVVMVSLSVKNSWLPCLITLVLLWNERLRPRGRVLAVAAAALLGVIGWLGYAVFLRRPDGSDVALFDYLHRELENAEANPFLNPLAANLVFVAFCLAGVIMKGLPDAVSARLRVMAGTGLAVWLAGGLYLSFAPDPLKIPYLVPLDVTRALWWIQYVMVAALGVALLKWLQRATSPAALGIAWGLLMGLYLLHWTFRAKLAVVVAGVTLVMTGIMVWRRRGVAAFDARTRLQIVAAAMCLGTVSLFAVGTVHRRWEALTFLVRHGIVGDNGGAVWVDVNPYLREHTPASATVFALASRNAIGEELGLRYEGSLRNRTGRSMPLGTASAFYVNYQDVQWLKAQRQHVQRVLEAWRRQDLAGISARLAALGSPDYLVVPTEHAAWLRDRPELGYQFETARGAFWIFRRQPS